MTIKLMQDSLTVHKQFPEKTMARQVPEGIKMVKPQNVGLQFNLDHFILTAGTSLIFPSKFAIVKSTTQP